MEKSNNSTTNVVWRDSSGKIVCPGDECEQKKCDETCPIFLNTSALMMIRIGENEKAIPTLKKIVKIAPDFYDAWNNLAACYGKSGDYISAYSSYSKAHAQEPQKPAAVYGLALSCKDMGKYDECIKWCDEYSILTRGHELDKIKADAITKLSSEKNNNSEKITTESATVPWKNSLGDIVCQDDKCIKAECDDSCPIWLYKKAHKYAGEENYDEALKLINQAIDIEPNSFKFWELKGNLHGLKKDRQGAYGCFINAYSVSPQRDNIISKIADLALSLKRYDDCKRFCIENKTISGSDELDYLQRIAELGLSGKKLPELEDYIMPFISLGVSDGYITKETPNIPEIYSNATMLVYDLNKEFFSESDVSEYIFTVKMLIYAGIVTALLWTVNPEIIKQGNIFNAIVEPNGYRKIEEKVEYMLKNTSKSVDIDKLNEHIANVDDIGSMVMKVGRYDNDEESGKAFFELCEAGFHYGLLLGFNIV